MNTREFKCAKILTDLVENHGLIGIKTSFEDEGATFNETIRLKEVCNQSKVKLNLKIGGPEAVRDMKDLAIIGVKGVVAPMVESAFGLKKFVDSINKTLPQDIVNSLQLFINVETQQAVNNIDSILSIKESDSLYAITVGRVDLVSSMGKDRSHVNSEEVFNMTKSVFTKVKQKGLKACLGGAVSVESLDFLKKLNSERLLDKFETRYAIFDPSITLKNLSTALSKAQMFEYEWLTMKHEYYTMNANYDLNRIKMIQDRINQSIDFK